MQTGPKGKKPRGNPQEQVYLAVRRPIVRSRLGVVARLCLFYIWRLGKVIHANPQILSPPKKQVDQGGHRLIFPPVPKRRPDRVDGCTDIVRIQYTISGWGPGMRSGRRQKRKKGFALSRNQSKIQTRLMHHFSQYNLSR